MRKDPALRQRCPFQIMCFEMLLYNQSHSSDATSASNSVPTSMEPQPFSPAAAVEVVPALALAVVAASEELAAAVLDVVAEVAARLTLTLPPHVPLSLPLPLSSSLSPTVNFVQSS